MEHDFVIVSKGKVFKKKDYTVCFFPLVLQACTVCNENFLGNPYTSVCQKTSCKIETRYKIINSFYTTCVVNI